jgi:predicted ferric reductase
MRTLSLWLLCALAVAVPTILALFSPQLAWRDPVYIAAGLSGIIAFALMLIQPLLAGGALPGLPARTARRSHVIIGTSIAALVLFHLILLWITSPPDVIDVLLLRSPTPFSIWGLLAMIAVLIAAALALKRRRTRAWRLTHRGLAVVTVLGSTAHAFLIEGTMETLSKTALCVVILLTTAYALKTKTLWQPRKRP